MFWKKPTSKRMNFIETDWRLWGSACLCRTMYFCLLRLLRKTTFAKILLQWLGLLLIRFDRNSGMRFPFLTCYTSQFLDRIVFSSFDISYIVNQFCYICRNHNSVMIKCHPCVPYSQFNSDNLFSVNSVLSSNIPITPRRKCSLHVFMLCYKRYTY